jgi:hypothetical protein
MQSTVTRPAIVKGIVVGVGAAALLLLVVYVGALLVVHRGNPDFFSIDSCLDDGGRWDYERRLCSAGKQGGR